MSQEFQLVLLDCPSCGAPIRAAGDDVVYYCPACRNGYRFASETTRLEPVEVAFIATPNKPADEYRPFWLLPAVVQIHQRTASGGAFSGLLGFFLGDSSGPRESGEGTFVIPAFQAPLRVVAHLSKRYTEALPTLGEKLGERLLGGRYGVEDAYKLAHYVLIASEVEKSDTLTELRYEIEFGPPRLLGVPFVRRSRGVADAIFDIPFETK